MKIGVVGAGMIGAATARYLSEAGQDVTLIGPPEPAQRDTHGGVFGSHYDEGRITRLLDPDPVWAELAAHSINRYRDIEQRSGIDFFAPVGHLMVAPRADNYISLVRETKAKRGFEAEEMDNRKLRHAFSYLSFEPDAHGYFQADQAGYISPRNLVAAQLKLAQTSGAKLLPKVVKRVSKGRVWTGNESMYFDHIIIACGAFSNSITERKLALDTLARTITFFELSNAEVAKLAGMPSLILRTSDGQEPYVLPPIRYPNGKIYLKIGGETSDRVVRGKDALCKWFKSAGSLTAKDDQINMTNHLMPELNYENIHSETCVVTYTKTGYPYIGTYDDGVTIATGGCGGAAKSSDEIGRIAAKHALGDRDDRFPVIFENEELE